MRLRKAEPLVNVGGISPQVGSKQSTDRQSSGSASDQRHAGPPLHGANPCCACGSPALPVLAV